MTRTLEQAPGASAPSTARAAFPPTPSRLLQRACACGGSPGVVGECAACRERRLPRSALGAAPLQAAPQIVHKVLGSAGRPLDTRTRAFLEPRFGHNFANVRVHTDARAAESARALNALAYTIGSDIAFAAGQYCPETRAGRRLLAHELTHVLQQREARSPASHGLVVAGQDSGQEREAERAASTLGARGIWNAELQSFVVQRQSRPDESEFVEEVEEADDPSEVRDGDAPVSASPEPDMEEASVGDVGTLLALAGPDEEAPMQEHGSGKDRPSKPPPKRKKPAKPRTITRIDVDQASQTMTLTWSDGTTEGPRPVSTGKGLPNTKDDPCKTQTEKNCTPNGDFKVGTRGDGSTRNSHGDAMSWYVGFVDTRGIGIHDSQPVPGTPASHGCVRVGNTKADDEYAKKINKHVLSGVTVVHVEGKAATKAWTKPVPKRKKK